MNWGHNLLKKLNLRRFNEICNAPWGIIHLFPFFSCLQEYLELPSFSPNADDNKIQKCKFNLRILRKQRESTCYTVLAIHVECIATDFHFLELFWQKLLFRFTLPHASGSWRRTEREASVSLADFKWDFSRLYCRSGRSIQVPLIVHAFISLFLVLGPCWCGIIMRPQYVKLIETVLVSEFTPAVTWTVGWSYRQHKK